MTGSDHHPTHLTSGRDLGVVWGVKATCHPELSWSFVDTPRAETLDLNLVLEAQSCSKVLLGPALRPPKKILRFCGHPHATQVPSGPLFGLRLKGGTWFLTHHQLKWVEKLWAKHFHQHVEEHKVGVCTSPPGSRAAEQVWVSSWLYLLMVKLLVSSWKALGCLVKRRGR